MSSDSNKPLIFISYAHLDEPGPALVLRFEPDTLTL